MHQGRLRHRQYRKTDAEVISRALLSRVWYHANDHVQVAGVCRRSFNAEAGVERTDVAIRVPSGMSTATVSCSSGQLAAPGPLRLNDFKRFSDIFAFIHNDVAAAPLPDPNAYRYVAERSIFRWPVLSSISKSNQAPPSPAAGRPSDPACMP